LHKARCQLCNNENNKKKLLIAVYIICFSICGRIWV
jgi:hypothetical protein